MTDSPIDEDGIRQCVASAFDAREPILVRGLGSKSAMLRPVQAARTLCTEACAGVVLHAPKELILTARAGTKVREIEATLAAAGQHLISEPPDLGPLLAGGQGASIGGIVATNLSGPRRIAWGATRDHLLGIRAVDGSGEIFRSGGRVLKNVTGLDLCKLLAGSHGTLGVITELTLKVLPAPETTGSLLLAGLDPPRAVAALAAALGSPFSVSGAAYLPADAAARVPGLPPGTATLIRIEEFTASVAYRLGRLRDLLLDFAPGVMIDDASSRAMWRCIRDAEPLPQTPKDAIWRLSLRPSSGAAVAEALATRIGARYFLDWGGGLVWLAATPDAASQQAISAAVTGAGGTWMLLRAPDSLRTAVDVIAPEPAPLAALSRRMKDVMDPRRILNPGRLYATL